MTTAHTADELRTMLETGAAAADSRYQRAAIHLLNFTELPGRAALDAYIETDTVTVDGRDVRAAWIRDWDAMGRLENLGYLSGGEERFVRLAASMAHGSPVDLCAALSSLGHAHARRVLEAVAICLGADEHYEITPTPALLESQRFEEQLLAGELSRRGLGPDGQPLQNPQTGETE
ncbi:hypothetical protein ACW2Q0_21010 [Nocardia sp. R16R-3T]